MRGGRQHNTLADMNMLPTAASILAEKIAKERKRLRKKKHYKAQVEIQYDRSNIVPRTPKY